MVLFVVSSVKIFSLFKQERDERNIFFFQTNRQKFLNETSLGSIKPRRVLSLSRTFKKADLFKEEEESIPLREDEDALVKVVLVTFVLPQFLFFLAPFREEEEEEENKFGGR